MQMPAWKHLAFGSSDKWGRGNGSGGDPEAPSGEHNAWTMRTTTIWPDQIEISDPEDALMIYQFGTFTAQNYFAVAAAFTRSSRRAWTQGTSGRITAVLAISMPYLCRWTSTIKKSLQDVRFTDSPGRKGISALARLQQDLLPDGCFVIKGPFTAEPWLARD